MEYVERIRPATFEDLPAIAVLENLFMENPWSIDVIEREYHSGTNFFIFENNVGYCSFKITLDECEIYNICIADKFRREGRARYLLESIANFARNKNVSKLILEVSSNNEPALALYKSLQFSEWYTRKNYYSIGNDAIIMQKKLL